MHPLARAVRRVVPFGRPPPTSRRPLTPGETRALLAKAGLEIESLENVGCAVVPDPLDRLTPLAYRAARRAERSARLRARLGTQRMLLARRKA
jgi:hypothetical protein